MNAMPIVSHEKEKYSHDPGELAGKLISAEKEDLHHVNEDNGHHEVRAPSVQCADEPPQSHVVIQILQTVPRLAGGRDINECQHDSGDELQKEHDEGGASKHIPPTGRVLRHGMLGNFTDGRGKLQSPVKPLPDLSDQAHRGFFPRRAALAPGVGNSPAWIETKPSCILCGYSNNPRSGGPEARDPSW